MLNATTTCQTDGSGTICQTLYGESTSTDQSIANGFTYGEVVLSTFGLLDFVLLLAIFYSIRYRKIKIKN